MCLPAPLAAVPSKANRRVPSPSGPSSFCRAATEECGGRRSPRLPPRKNEECDALTPRSSLSGQYLRRMPTHADPIHRPRIPQQDQPQELRQLALLRRSQHRAVVPVLGGRRRRGAHLAPGDPVPPVPRELARAPADWNVVAHNYDFERFVLRADPDAALRLPGDPARVLALHDAPGARQRLPRRARTAVAGARAALPQGPQGGEGAARGLASAQEGRRWDEDPAKLALVHAALRDRRGRHARGVDASQAPAPERIRAPPAAPRRRDQPPRRAHRPRLRHRRPRLRHRRAQRRQRPAVRADRRRDHQRRPGAALARGDQRPRSRSGVAGQALGRRCAGARSRRDDEATARAAPRRARDRASASSRRY